MMASSLPLCVVLPRLTFAATIVSVGLAVSTLGMVPSAAAARVPSRISARLSRTTFTVTEVGKVKLSYKFSSRSARFDYVLSRKQGANWLRVRSTSNRGSFRGSHTMTVKQLFGPKPVSLGQYRVKLSADANSVTLSFMLAKAAPAPAPKPPEAAKPQAGSWVATSLSGPVSGPGDESRDRTNSVTATSVFFTVTADQATVSGFGFAYRYSGEPFEACIGSGSTTDQASAPITNGQFSTPAANPWSDPMSAGVFNGTFDSPTTAHGTAWVRIWIGAFNCKWIGHASTGTFTWTATRQAP